MNILVMGLGFVGLTTALGLAEKGHNVYGFDADTKKNNELAEGKTTLSETGIQKALNHHLGKNFNICKTLPAQFPEINAAFICVGTPCDAEGGADLKYVYGSIDILESILKSNLGNTLLVIKSTVPPSTTQNKIIPYLRNKGIAIKVANNPEFLREGYCWEDFINPDRIVCGTEDTNAAELMKAIYKDFNAPVVITSLNTAEFIKYLSNNMLASMISFSNEMSIIAGAIGGISVKQAFETLHMDRRWNGAPMKSYVYPGCGFGGYCLPKDLEAMITHAKNYGISPALLESVEHINKNMPSYFVKQMKENNPQSVGILGLSFKPNSDDVRESPVALIIEELIKNDVKQIYAYDPQANRPFKEKYPFSVHYRDSADEVCRQSDTVMIATAWSEFKGIDKKYPNVKFIDGRYML